MVEDAVANDGSPAMIGFMELNETLKGNFEARKQRYINAMVKLYGDEMRRPIEVVDQIWSEVRGKECALSSLHRSCRINGVRVVLPCLDAMNFLPTTMN